MSAESDVPPAACDPLRITAFVDGALAPEERDTVLVHLASCPTCHDQEVFERGLRQRLRDLPPPPLPPRLAQRVRARIRPRRAQPLRLFALAAAAGVVLGVLFGRGAPGFVAWQLSRDHRHCFSQHPLPAQVWSSDPVEVAAWFEQQGQTLPIIPAQAGGLELVGGRFCPMLDRRTAHLYYASPDRSALSRDRRLSVYVVPGPVRLDRPFESEPEDTVVHLRRTAGTTIALISADPKAITSFRKAFERTVADLTDSPPITVADGVPLLLD